MHYRFVKFAVVAIGLVLLALVASTVGASNFIDDHQSYLSKGKSTNHILSHHHHRRKGSKNNNRMACKPKANSQSFWIRNECHEGFLAIISDRRVVTVNTAINEHDATGKIIDFYAIK